MREECGLLDRSARGKLLVRGAEAAEFLQGQLTNDIEGLGSGEGCYAALLDRKGRIQADMRVLRIAPEEIWLGTEPEARDTVVRHLEMYKVGRDLELFDRTEKHVLYSLLGPGSSSVSGVGPLPEFACADALVGGVACLAAGTRDGIDLFAAIQDGAKLREALLAAGATEVAEEAAEILRVEAGVPRFGREMGPKTMPAEAGIVDRAVNFDKGCYIGQEPVARLHYRGKPNRGLRGLRLSDPVPAGSPLRLGEKEVGKVGTACVSPASGPIALAVVRREAEPGVELAVGEDGVTGEVTDLPFR